SYVFSFVGVSSAQAIVLPQEKNPGLAALCSLAFAGGGQIHNGELGKGFGIMGGQALLVTIATVSFSRIDPTNIEDVKMPTTTVVALLGSVALSGWAMYDVYSTAEKINEREVTKHLNAYVDGEKLGVQFAFEF